MPDGWDEELNLDVVQGLPGSGLPPGHEEEEAAENRAGTPPPPLERMPPLTQPAEPVPAPPAAPTEKNPTQL
jgi:hypothetical protein